jgi:two-component system, OmpR family, sensor histidine kinase QseC
VSDTNSSELTSIAGLIARSVRARLMLLLMLGITVMWLVTAGAMYGEARRSAERLFDHEVEGTAKLLLGIAEHELFEEHEQPAELGVGALGAAGQDIAYQLLDGSGRVLTRSPLAPAQRMATPGVHAAEAEINGEQWRVISEWSPGGELAVLIGETHERRDREGRTLALRMVLPFVVGLPLVAIFSWMMISRGLRPIEAVTRQLSGRAPHDLQPLTVNEAPREILPLVVEINRLFRRVHDAFTSEKRFTSDAAHELRTPLAAIRAQAQVALRAAVPEEQAAALRQLIAAVDRATHLIDQLLLLARLDPGGAGFEQSLVDLEQVADLAIAEVRPAAEARNVQVEHRTEHCEVIGNTSALRVLIRNLLDNAVRYSAEGGRVQVLVRRNGRTAFLEVADSGPGLTEEQRERVFDRFYRGQRAVQPGSGLGMSIVKRVAELHDATIQLGPGIDGSGLGVTVRIPI